MTMLSTLMILAALALPVQAGRPAPAVPSFAGTWTLTADTPHGVLAFGLTIEQTDAKATGTLTTPHGEVPVAGEIVEGQLTLKPTIDSDLALTARVTSDGGLAGIVSHEMGDVAFAGKRVKSFR